jgi:aryl-alcohol dehydrogenase-like predicted oxidoreductase
MEYTKLGDTGLNVSRLWLGCMGFGSERDWMVDAESATAIIDRAVELGITCFDTANVYSRGESEQILGDALAEHDRDRCVVATKVYDVMDPTNPNSGGLSRKAIEQAVGASKRRLGVDTIDLYQLHRWDDETPVAETVRTLDDLLRRGDVRYLGASEMWGFQFAELCHTADRLDTDGFAAMQTHYNLVHREPEREMLRLCDHRGVGVLPWAPLARGYLARPHAKKHTTPRGENLTDGRQDVYEARGGESITDRIAELADEKDISMAQLALAWLFHQPAVDAPVLGVTSVEQLEDAVEATRVSLSRDDRQYLEAPYQPV